MIETTQTVTIAAPIDRVWDYVRDVERWATIMPGYQSCQIVDADHSLWVLKIGVGGLVRTVRVEVDVAEWAGPERVRFAFRLKGDPVQGTGSYRAVARGPAETRVELHVAVAGGGPMAPMWEAMGGPVLPKFAASFAGELKARIEGLGGPADPTPAAQAARPSPLARLLARLRTWLRGLF
ncbi:CoxG family protein [Novosphingobium album (ex Liu et al. 2023)]|uniref:SRPBCC family protein n=1 Tax=Novosphingobium album (ex Liu et al. 2023) TaxID=3031130 RepID=A0ABT5WN82_9SPHN|nr:SRPBCC family protein [Novosphingobium album (ex Liu et al. 2023)]MDE8651329.1 SRPBCC family protein [Novosphingobium album (ex Liu et al. 2023)]